jgi:opacity protein-like surface antigen
MTIRRPVLCGSFVAILTLAAAGAAPAQTPGHTRVSGLVSGSLSGGNAAPTVGLAASYQFSRWLGAEGDFSHFADLTLVESLCGPSDQCNSSLHARASTVTGNAIVRLPGWAKTIPYLAAGGGVAFVRRNVEGRPDFPPFVRHDKRPVVSVGGGLEFLVTPRVGVGLDLRFQRIIEDPRLFRPNLRNTTRVGTTIGYRF